MMNRKVAVGVAGLCLAVGVSGVAVAANSAAVPNSITVKQKGGVKFVPNRYVQDQLRWNRDVYKVRSGGTVTLLNNVANEGPHTFSVVKRKDLPKSFDCKACNQIAQAHGADPNSDAPPKFQFVENGVGQDTAPNVDRPGDSVLSGEGKKGEKVTFKITARKGSQLYFACVIHPWMQAKLQVQ